MTPIAWMTFVLICGTVWGGFIGLLLRALKRERQKGEK